LLSSVRSGAENAAGVVQDMDLMLAHVCIDRMCTQRLTAVSHNFA
jgi:hypothetical protein